jgi:hypothetical protein
VDEPKLQELIQNAEGDVSVMGLEKVLDDIKRKADAKVNEKPNNYINKKSLGTDCPRLIVV